MWDDNDHSQIECYSIRIESDEVFIYFLMYVCTPKYNILFNAFEISIFS